MSRLLFLMITLALSESAAVRKTTNAALKKSAPSSVQETTLQVANAVTKLLSGLPIKNQLVTALSVPVARAYDTIRPGLKAIGIAYLAYQALMYLLPSLVVGSEAATTQRSGQNFPSHRDHVNSKSLSEAIGELGVGAMVQSLQSLNFTPRSTEILNTWEQDCKRRAACELGKSLAERIPYVAWILGYFGPKFPVIGQFADAFSQGLGRPDCSLLYQECPYVRSLTES